MQHRLVLALEITVIIVTVTIGTYSILHNSDEACNPIPFKTNITSYLGISPEGQFTYSYLNDCVYYSYKPITIGSEIVLCNKKHICGTDCQATCIDRIFLGVMLLLVGFIFSVLVYFTIFMRRYDNQYLRENLSNTN